jgi:hypothetical protein
VARVGTRTNSIGGVDQWSIAGCGLCGWVALAVVPFRGRKTTRGDSTGIRHRAHATNTEAQG